MKKVFAAYAAFLSTAVLSAVPVHAAYDMYLQLEGMSTRNTVTFEPIEVRFFRLAVVSVPSSNPSGAGAPLPDFEPLEITGVVSPASSYLFEALILGDHFASAELLIGMERTTGWKPTASWEFEIVLPQLYVTGAESGATELLDEYTLDFGRVAYTYYAYNENDKEIGRRRVEWDVIERTINVEEEGTVPVFRFLTAIPEPASLTLLAGAGVAILGRRRRG